MLGAAGVERDSAQGVSSLFPNWKGAFSKTLKISLSWQIDVIAFAMT